MNERMRRKATKSSSHLYLHTGISRGRNLVVNNDAHRTFDREYSHGVHWPLFHHTLGSESTFVVCTTNVFWQIVLEENALLDELSVEYVPQIGFLTTLHHRFCDRAPPGFTFAFSQARFR